MLKMLLARESYELAQEKGGNEDFVEIGYIYEI